MSNKGACYILASIIILTLVLGGCSGSPQKSSLPATTVNNFNNPAARQGSITTGQKVEAASQSIDAAGGTLAISKPGDPLDGFVVEVPAQSYSGKSTFKISYAPITGQTFGKDINPISPMITIDNSGLTADKMVYVRIPAKVPAGSFAMGFIYDVKTGHLEGLPLVGSDADSVTIATTHFCDFFLSMIDKALLKSDIDSGFKPRVDDWQFTNFGSYIAPGGHCEGQSVTALWYYCTKPDGSDAHLYGRYDNNGDKPATPDLWQDDSLGYRFASEVQNSCGADVTDFWTNIQGKKWVWENNQWKTVDIPLGISEETTWNLFAYSMQATGEPQLVCISSSSGGGHAMIVYHIKDGQLYIADPNYPGNLDRRIEYTSGKFSPYNSGANADEIAKGNGKAYEKIYYYAKTTVLPWDTVATLWTKLKSKTVGNDNFPPYALVYQKDENQWAPLTDGTLTPFDAIDIRATSGSADLTVAICRDGKWLSFDGNGNNDLVPGNNKLGICVKGKVDGSNEYIDFKYVNVIYGGLAIDPLTLDGETNKEYTFTVKADNPPANARYSWIVDNSIIQTDSQKTFETTFKTPGKHTVVVKLLDASGKELQKAESTANIKDASKLTITPDMLKGEVGKEYTFTASIANPPTGAITYEWLVNGAVKKSSAETSFKNTFTTDGQFTVSLRALQAGKEIGKSDSNVTITKSASPSPSPSAAANNLAVLQQYGYLEATLDTSSMVHVFDKNTSPQDVDKQQNVHFWTLYTPITWTGVNFSGTKTDNPMGAASTQSISGTVSPDGNTILTMTCKLQAEATNQKTSVTMVLQNIPLTYTNGVLNYANLTGANVQKYVVSLEYSVNNLYMGSTYNSVTYKSPVWGNDSSLSIQFRKTATR